jgi:hypothetical protein
MNNIEFICEDKSIMDHFPIKPANKVIPDWYKDLDKWHSAPGVKLPTVKHCMPVQDYITSGYIIQNTFEVILKSNVGKSPEDFAVETHNPEYIGGHYFQQLPVEFDNKNKNYIKIVQPWIIKTPPGYSCLFVQPFYHFEKRFKLFPSIVDTDKHDMIVNLPGVLLSDKEITLEPYTPLMQVIPFKRENWEMSMSVEKREKSLLDFFFRGGYRRLFHKKKTYK